MRKTLGSGALAGLFFGAVYLYVWLLVDPRLIHHSLGILTPYSPFVVHTGWPFLNDHLARVGGLSEYLVRLLSQCYAVGWAGALVVAGAAWCMGRLADGIARRAGMPGAGGLQYFPAAILLMMYSGYSHPIGPAVSLLMAVAGFLLYARCAPSNPAARGATLLAASGASYYVAGTGGLLFAILAAVDEWLIGQRWTLAAPILACALAMPGVVSGLLGLDANEAYSAFLVADPGIAPGKWSYTLALYLFFPTLLAGSFLKGQARVGAVPDPSKAAAAPSKGPRKATPCSSRATRRFFLPAVWVRTVAALCAAGVAAWLCWDGRTRTVLAMDFLANRGRWSEVLRVAQRLPAGVYNPRSALNVILALYHTGRLGDEMFHYPQRRDVDWFATPTGHRDLGAFFQESRLYLELGQVNLAERCAYEALATSGEQPEILEHLAMIHALTGRPQTAKMFLRTLGRHLFYRGVAHEMLRRLEADPSLEHDPRASRIRANAVATDLIAQEAGADELLQALLRKNPKNRMAFELLMARYLSDGRPDKVVANLDRLRDFAYPKIPRHYQEALVAHAWSCGRSPLDFGFPVDPAVLDDAGDFQRITTTSGGPHEAVRAALEAGLGGTYFFYLAHGISGG
jgi:tetratricopeptide (TPR) repeat protein